MCRSIKTLRPPYTPAVSDEEVRAAALQYVRKVSGFRAPATRNAEAFRGRGRHDRGRDASPPRPAGGAGRPRAGALGAGRGRPVTRPAGGPDTAARVPDSGHDPRRLVLIRHAKADPGGGADTDRPLADRGVADAAAIGRWLADHGVAPDRVVVSPARRARQTWELAAGETGAAPQPVLDERVYDSTLDDLLAVVRGTPPEADTLVLVGHNPGIEALAVTLDDGRGDAAARGELRRKYPTSGVSVFVVATDWPRVAAGTGRLTAFAVPRG